MAQFAILLPEILLALMTMSLQMFAVYFKSRIRSVMLFAILTSIILVLFVVTFNVNDIGFDGSFLVTPEISIFKAIILMFSLMSIVIYSDLCKIEHKKAKIEFVTLILLSTLGVFISISARDFLILFCGLELQALSGYALAAFNNKDVKSSEAGLKYFILGAFMSCVMLFGISFLYGYSGSVKFIAIGNAMNNGFHMTLVIGAVMMISSILFKLSVAPVHFWTPDVYEGAPISAVSYFSVAQKIGMLIVFLNIIDTMLYDVASISYTIIKFVALLSMIIGSFGAIMQNSIKRLMAYSSILNMGYVMIGVCLGSSYGKYYAFLYMFIYAISTIGFFSCLVALFGKKADEVTFEDLKGLASERKTLSAAIAILMFSLVGIPPFAGFFGKYLIIYTAILHGEITLAIIAVLTSVVAAFYYLKIIKYLYFEDITPGFLIINSQRGLSSVSILSSLFVIFFFIFASSYIV